MVISSRNLGALPDIPVLRRLTQSLAMLDAINEPAWDDRYYSFDSQWGQDEQMASMRDGSGDEWFALFTTAGVALKGLAHESPMFRMEEPWPGIFEGYLRYLLISSQSPPSILRTAPSVFGASLKNRRGTAVRFPIPSETIRTAQVSC